MVLLYCVNNISFQQYWYKVGGTKPIPGVINFRHFLES